MRLAHPLLAAGVAMLAACGGSSGPTYGGGTGGGGGGTPSANQVNMQNIAFNPTTLTVTKGTAVIWVNKDGIVHTTTSDAGSSQMWDSGDMAGGATRSVTFNTPGTYPYHCAYHSVSYGMKGTIIVQ